MTYDRRVGRVIEHIRGNLEADLSLEALAKVAHFSPYHSASPAGGESAPATSSI